jgi:thiosulfate/3-mercaptopyruvate sulfurtransferase
MGPIDDWISSAKENRIGFDDLAFWKGECVKLGLGPDAVTVVADDGGMLVRAT